jgi:cysteine desulfurase/selenocysteine lyase
LDDQDFPLIKQFDITRARNDTKACANTVHFNNAGASLMPAVVTDAFHFYLHEEEQLGGYEAQDKHIESLSGMYASAAKLVNCSTQEIAFVENATRGWDYAFYSFAFKPGDKILTTLAEYGSNVIAYIQQVRRFGVEIVFVPNDEFGQIDINALASLIDDKVKLISITHIPTGGGLVNPAKRIGAIARSAGIPFILDTCQSVGHIPIDVEDIGCDVLCATGRKYLRGPRGTGFLYIRQSLLEQLEPPMLDQHAATLISSSEYHIRSDAKRFESWEQNCAGKYALAKAIDYADSWGMESIQERIYYLAALLRSKLADIDGIISTDEGQEQCGIVTFYCHSRSALQIKSHLANHRINVSISSGSGNLISFQKRGITEVVRASLHYFNTEQEIDYFLHTLNGHMRKNTAP